jgi:hypothetical protein
MYRAMVESDVPSVRKNAAINLKVFFISQKNFDFFVELYSIDSKSTLK